MAKYVGILFNNKFTTRWHTEFIQPTNFTEDGTFRWEKNSLVYQYNFETFLGGLVLIVVTYETYWLYRLTGLLAALENSRTDSEAEASGAT